MKDVGVEDYLPLGTPLADQNDGRRPLAPAKHLPANRAVELCIADA